MDKKHIVEEIDNMDDLEFLTKMKLLYDGKVTNAAMLLLGHSDYDYLISRPPTLMWRLYGSQGEVKDYEIFTIPFINVIDKIFSKIHSSMILGF